MSVHEQALANARRDGFLVNLTLDVGVRQSWMEEAHVGKIAALRTTEAVDMLDSGPGGPVPVA